MLTGRFLGVDGGQSATTAVIGDQHGKILGWATAGPCNHVAAPEAQEKFLRVMRECISEAANRAGMAPFASSDAARHQAGDRWHFSSACLGMSGGAADKSALLQQLLDAEHLVITDDAGIALAGATAGEPGIVVIGGTGSIAFGKNARGETARAGGWGYIFGDEGSAFDIVRQALRTVLREHEGWGARTALTPALLEATGAADPDELLHLFYKPEWPRSRVAGLAKIVNRIAEEGDPLAAIVLQNAAQQLALFAASVRNQLWAEEEPVTVSWTGGVFGSDLLLERFRSLVSISGNATAREPAYGPAKGALILAYRAPGLPVLPEA
jgi:N-acetylglucosamine kinase-like BadF-type ATPase